MSKTVVLILAVFSCAGAFCQSSPFAGKLSQELQFALNQAATQYGITGLSASVYMNDECFWEGASGITIPGGSAVSPSMLFTFGSITKTVVAAIAMNLVEEGKISLDDRVYGILPTDLNYYSSVTIRQLMNHTSGVAEYLTIPLLENAWRGSQAVNWEPLNLMQNYLPAPIFLPGKDAIYSNSNYVLLGMAIESITDVSLEEHFIDRIVTPLGLENTFLISNAPVLENWASTRVVGSRNFSAIWSAGNLGSTVREVAKFGQSLFRSKIISETTVELMLTESEFGAYALGVWKPLIGGLEAWGHNGGVDGDISEMFYFPSLEITIAYSSTSPAERPPALAITSALLSAYLDNQIDSDADCMEPLPEPGPRSLSLDSAAIFNWYLNGELVSSNLARVVKGESIDVRAEIILDSRDLDSIINTYLVVKSQDALYQRTGEDNFITWDGDIDSLLSQGELMADQQSLEIIVADQSVDTIAEFELYLAYSNSQGELHYSKEPLLLTITE